MAAAAVTAEAVDADLVDLVSVRRVALSEQRQERQRNRRAGPTERAWPTLCCLYCPSLLDARALAPRRAHARPLYSTSPPLPGSPRHPAQVAPAPKTASPSPLPTAQGLAASLAPQSEALTRLKLAFALPWRRTGSRAVLVIRAEGDIGDKPSGGRIFGGSTLTVPQIVRALEKAALDPRIEGVALRIGPISAGWAKLQEIGEAFAAFRASGKWSRAWIERGGEKELYLATMADRVCVPPVPGSLSVRGIVLAGTFLRGPLEKAGVTPEITRIGAFKSAGDSLLRKDMSEAQREALGAIVDDVYSHYTEEVAARRGLTPAAVAAALDAAFTEPGDLIKAGLIDGTQYEDEVRREGGGGGRGEKAGGKRASISPHSSIISIPTFL